MSGGLAALLDDVAALARVAAASVDDVAAGAGRASMKAAGVIVDDAAVTPRYVQGFSADRELPMIKRIAKGSLRNKVLFILPVALVLSELLDWLLTPLLMLGGLYLCYEGAEKIWEKLGPGHHDAEAHAGDESEEALVRGAIRTDFILSAEIMVIALNEVTDEPLVSRALILIGVAFAITALVYGAVALIVKMDDIGLRLLETGQGVGATVGRGLVRGMPIVMSVLSTVGIAAMLWVGGHILLVGLDDLGVHGLYDAVHHLEEDVHDVLGGIGGWLTNTLASALLGIVVGAILVGAMTLRTLFTTLVLALALTATAGAKPAGPRIALPDGWQPEGIAAGPGRSLYVGSIPTGAILRLNAKSGATKTVVPGREGHAATGVEVDRGHLLAAGGGTGSIFAYDRRTGAELKAFDVDGGFVNDIARSGKAFYVTDSRLPVMYRVARNLSGVETVPLPDIEIEDGNNLNGIEATRTGYLVAVQSNTGTLWRIDPGLGAAKAIDLGGATLVNGDGLLLRGRTLLVVQNRDNKIAVVKLSKDFASGKVKRTITSADFDVPTTLARQRGHLYAVNARFGTTDPQPAPYWVTRVR